jgi:hypothetical protein
MEEPILTSDLMLGSLSSFNGQESLTPVFDAPPVEDGVGEVAEEGHSDEVPSQTSLAE